MMPSLQPSSESGIGPTAGLEIFEAEPYVSSWSYNGRNQQFWVQMPSFQLLVKNMCFADNNLSFVGQFFHSNGKTLAVGPSYRQTFLAIANKNGQNFHFFTEQDGKQLLLKCSLSFDSNISTLDKINYSIKYLQKILPSFQMALQSVALKSKFNKFSYQMLKRKLQLKKNIISALNANSDTASFEVFTAIPSENSSVIRVKQVVQKTCSGSPDQQSPNKKGGYFSVQKKSSIIRQLSGDEDEKELAWKVPINPNAHQTYLYSKMKRQLQCVSKIVNDKFLLNYYVSETQPNFIFMNYVPTLLKDCIYRGNLTFTQLLNLAQQLIEAVGVLHKSGLVHRDLKPENILVEGETLKIIDYAESAMTDETFSNQHLLGYTLPYSAIQCSLGKEEGFNKKEIDLWSISIILYEVAFKAIPMFYSRWIGSDILGIWRSSSDFSIFPIYRKSRGIRSIEQVISLISIRGIQMNPKDRLSLATYHKLVSYLQQYYGSFSN